MDSVPCVDGQMGGVIKTYRDYKLCGDRKWLKKLWPSIKKSIEFAWAETNEDKWDYDRDGVMEGRQHHTLDMELFGPSGWLNGFYQTALKAGAEIAQILGHTQEAKLYQSLFENGKKWTEKHLFNGEYYQQEIQLNDIGLLERYNEGKPLEGKDSVDAYWNEESGQIKYQIANGSSIDQVVAQWHANLSGLGDVFDRKHVKSALSSIYRYNYRKNVRNEVNVARIYCMNDEGGVKICAWPPDAEKPAIPITYSDEMMCGFEYQVAAHMIQEGMLEEGFEIVKSVRSRFDGEKRNPWNEFECGSNYARSMASYSLIPSISGFAYDMDRHYIGFDPKKTGNDFYTFWSVDSAWGSFSCTSDSAELIVFEGELCLKHLALLFLKEKCIKVRLGESFLACSQKDGCIHFNVPVVLEKGMKLDIIC